MEKDFKGVVKLTEEQYKTLKETGSITVGEITYNYSPTDTVYVTEKVPSLPTIQWLTN